MAHATFNMRGLMASHTLTATVEIGGMRRFRAGVWIGKKLIGLAAWFMGLGGSTIIEVSVDGNR